MHVMPNQHLKKTCIVVQRDKISSFGSNFDRVSCEPWEPENQGLIKQERKKDVFKQLHHRSLQLLSSPCLHRRVSKVKS